VYAVSPCLFRCLRTVSGVKLTVMPRVSEMLVPRQSPTVLVPAVPAVRGEFRHVQQNLVVRLRQPQVEPTCSRRQKVAVMMHQSPAHYCADKWDEWDSGFHGGEHYVVAFSAMTLCSSVGNYQCPHLHDRRCCSLVCGYISFGGIYCLLIEGKTAFNFASATKAGGTYCPHLPGVVISCYLFNDAVSNSDCISSNDSW
jgi:hypothetical protein